GITDFSAEPEAGKSGLGGFSWAAGAASGVLRWPRSFPGDVLPCGRLAGARRDTRLCETKPTLLAPRTERGRFRAATGGQRGSGFGCAVLAAAETYAKGESNGHGDDD